VEFDPESGLISILGGKWTTHRLMGQETIDKVQEYLGERVTASHAAGRRESRHREPARVADRTRERTRERRAARGTERREKDPNERVGGVGEHDDFLRPAIASARPVRRAKSSGNERGIAIFRNDL